MNSASARSLPLATSGLARLYRRIGKRTESDEHFATADDDVRERGMTYWRETAEAER